VSDDRFLLNHVAGNLALDFANTFSWRGTARQIDHLGDVEAVLAWGSETGLIDRNFSVPKRMHASLMKEVHHLRHAIDEAGSTIAQGRSPGRAALGTIRDLAARSLARAKLTGAPARIVFSDDDRIIGPISWAALDLLRGNELSRLKQCPPHDCRWLFIDRTRNGSRRWCEMATCGDRAKKGLISLG
jgi:predicted RNA-binding Zn ribbon-like protein